jgi:hypothetical protein
MALEPRLRRRLLGTSVIEAMNKAEAEKADHYARHMVPGAHSADETVGYVLLILAYHGEAPGPAYTEYRKRRVLLLHGYCLNLLRENRALKRAVEIGIDASPEVTGRHGSSEDFYALEVSTWTPELEKHVQEYKDELRLLKPENVTHGASSVDEFPLSRDSDAAPEVESEFHPAKTVETDRRLADTKAGSKSAIVKPDAKWPNMYRVYWRSGKISDMTNLTRAKDAAR